MKQYETFVFDSYAFEPKAGKIELCYSLDDELHFAETLTLPAGPLFDIQDSKFKLQDSRLDAALFALHLVGGVSYFKTCCPRKIEVRSGVLSEEQAEFWNTVYEEGLGQFFYENQLDFRRLIRFPHGQESGMRNKELGIKNQHRKIERVLVPVGGGKDSAVTTELLKNTGYDVTLFRVGKHPLIEEIARVAGLPLLTIERQLSPTLFKLNEEGALNGHVPITAYLSFLAVVTAILYDFDAVVMSNERSASVGNVQYLGKEINHQWSKSLAFERMFQAYVREHIAPTLEYFSLLRPLSELSIAKRFAQFPQYFSCTTSCNANWRLATRSLAKQSEVWCGKCPKCAFTFALLAAFLPKEKLLSIFGKNLFGDATLLPLYRQLLGLEGMKPFECVGTPEEIQAAFLMAHALETYEETPAMQMFGSESLTKISERAQLIQEVLTPSSEHAIPEHFLPVLKRDAKKWIPRCFRELDGKKVCILGFGIEGQATLRALERYAPSCTITIADQNQELGSTNYECQCGPAYLDRLDRFDVIIKSPGVPPESRIKNYESRITSATQLFLNAIAETGALVIGVTGSKGKSTTSSLIYEILKAAGNDAYLIGNIGIPALDFLERTKSNTIFVQEMSSYQLMDLTVSPHIAVITAFFPEHLDYHGSLGAYLEAKKHITRFQHERDSVIFSADSEGAREIAGESRGKRIPYSASDSPVRIEETQLLGKHNLSNIAAAWKVVQELGVPREIASRAIKNFHGLPHRLQSLGAHDGIEWIDDSISTTPESAIAALNALGEHVNTIILGGQDRGNDFTELGKRIAASQIENIILFPVSGPRIRTAIEKAWAGTALHFFEIGGMEEAITISRQYTKRSHEPTIPRPIVLLSPASPSYGLFRNFEERGEAFRRAIMKTAPLSVV